MQLIKVHTDRSGLEIFFCNSHYKIKKNIKEDKSTPLKKIDTNPLVSAL